MSAEDRSEERTQELLKALKFSAGESDRGIVLIVAAHIDECLRRLITSFLIDSKDIDDLFDEPYAPFGSLSGKAKATFFMGLITKQELERINAVRKVRNAFAHEVDATFEHPDIKKICAKPPISDGVLCDRDAFLHVAQNTVLPLLYRDLEEGPAWKRKELMPPSASKTGR